MLRLLVVAGKRASTAVAVTTSTNTGVRLATLRTAVATVATVPSDSWCDARCSRSIYPASEVLASQIQ